MSTMIALPRRTLRIRRVADKTGLAETSIWRLVNQRQFPLPVKLSRGCTAWFEHEIDEWLDGKGSKRETDTACGLDPERGGAL
jgi:prophage regulatory protein